MYLLNQMLLVKAHRAGPTRPFDISVGKNGEWYVTASKGNGHKSVILTLNNEER